MTTITKFFSFVVAFFFVSLFTSCEKAEVIIEAISESEAAEIFEANLQSNAGGLVTKLEDMAEQFVSAVASGELCDTLYTETKEEDFQGAQFQASYTSELSYEMTCNALNVPQTASFSTLTLSMYNSRRIISDDDGSFAGNVTGLQPSSTTMNISGEYSRTGSQELNFREQKDINSTLTINLSELEMSKQGFEIESGYGTLVLTGSAVNETFFFDGNIVFNGGKTATLTINGATYDIDWN